jgi:rod shape determining protein RodA
MNGRAGRAVFAGAQLAVVAPAFAIATIGILLVYSAATGSRFSVITNHHMRQLFWFGLGTIAFFSASAIPFTLYEGLRAYVGWVVGVVLLALVLAVGSSSLGAQRWLEVGGLRFQPSELARLATVVALAQYLAGRRRNLMQVRNLILPGVFAFLPMILILRQPDLGTSLSFPFILLAMLFWAGLPLPFLGLLASPVVSLTTGFSATSWGLFAVAFVLTLYWCFVRHRLRWVPVIALVVVNLAVGIATPHIWGGLKEYQRDRITAFLNPTRDRHGSGYQIIQSEIAIGSGGLLGQGYLQGTQKNFQFLPEKHTDFVFSVVGEEFGFLGCMVVLGLYLVLLSGVIEIAQRARSRFAGLLAFGIGAHLFFNMVVNVGVTVGFAPVTGLPLPLLSYGGTALLINLTALGLVVGVGRHRHEY